MKKQLKNIKKIIIGAVAFAFVGVFAIGQIVNAATSFNLSPMNQIIVLNPGDSYRSTINISNPSTSDDDFNYRIVVQPFYMNNEGVNVYDESSDRTMMTDWITILGDTEGTIAPNDNRDIEFVINVPEWAPAGGQYASLNVSSNNSSDAEEGSFGIQENIAMAHLIYAEIAGNTVRQGEIESASVPSFLFSGNITGNSTIKNTGNVHGTAKYTLKVFPVFSGEELYTNEENPATAVILPDRDFYNETAWNETPMVGIFNVVYTVEFEGVTTEVSKMVIKCPIWLLFIILAVIAGIIIWIVLRIRMRGKKKE